MRTLTIKSAIKPLLIWETIDRAQNLLLGVEFSQGTEEIKQNPEQYCDERDISV